MLHGGCGGCCGGCCVGDTAVVLLLLEIEFITRMYNRVSSFSLTFMVACMTVPSGKNLAAAASFTT